METSPTVFLGLIYKMEDGDFLYLYMQSIIYNVMSLSQGLNLCTTTLGSWPEFIPVVSEQTRPISIPRRCGMLGAKLVNSKTKNATRMIQKQQRFLGNKTEHGCFFFLSVSSSLSLQLHWIFRLLVKEWTWMMVSSVRMAAVDTSWSPPLCVMRNGSILRCPKTWMATVLSA